MEEEKVLTVEDIKEEKNTKLLMKARKDKEKRVKWLKRNRELVDDNENYEILYKLPISDKVRNELLNNKNFFD
jgi:hypothetical protein